MKVHVLASGSTGNAVLFQFGESKILVDAGISCRRIEHGLQAIGTRAGELDAVLLTHEHTDHIKGLDVFIRKYQLPVFARPATWSKIDCRKKFPGECIKELEGTFSLGKVLIEPFAISHDAIDPVGFCFYYGKRKAVIATDLGMVSREVEKALSFSDIAVLESNHDPQMLKNGPYPPYLKKRIEGREGHLSNFDTARLLSSVPRHNPMQVLLAHISQQNNHPMLAQQTVSKIMQDSGCEVGREIGIYPTFPHHGITCTMTRVFAVNAPLFQWADLLAKQDGRGKAN